jgi:hypothetical protein
MAKCTPWISAMSPMLAGWLYSALATCSSMGAVVSTGTSAMRVYRPSVQS